MIIDGVVAGSLHPIPVLKYTLSDLYYTDDVYLDSYIMRPNSDVAMVFK